MNSTLIAVLAVVVLVLLLVLLRRFSGKKVLPEETPAAEAPPEVREEPEVQEREETVPAVEKETAREVPVHELPLLADEAITPLDEGAEKIPVARVSAETAAFEEEEFELTLEAEPEPEEEKAAAEEVEAEEIAAEAELELEIEEAAAEEVEAEEVVAEAELELEVEEAAVEETEKEVAVEEVAAEAEPVPEAEVPEEAPGEAGRELPVVVVSLEAYEKQLFSLKEDRLAALAVAIDSHNEIRRELLQVELVSITRALSFLEQGYEEDIACRRSALESLEKMKPEINASAYATAVKGLCDGDTGAAENEFMALVEAGSPQAPFAAYQSGCLAEKRMDLSTAMERLGKAVALEGENLNFLWSAASLALRLYQYKKALKWFATLVKLLEARNEDTVELALARRDLGYIWALIGQHKKAGGFYKQAMVSLTRLVGKEDREMGISWFQIGKLQEALGKYEKADEPYTLALAIIEQDENNPVLGEVLDKLARLYTELEREKEAIPLFERLCAFKERAANPDQAALALTYSNLAEAYRICGNYAESEKKYERAMEITEELRGKDHAAVGSILQELAKLCQRQGKTAEAREYQERSAAIFQQVLEEQEAKGQQAASLTL